MPHYTTPSDYVYKVLTPDQVDLMKRLDLVTEYAITSQFLDRALQSNVETVTMTLSAAEIIELSYTPLEVVPAPGAGKTIFVSKVFTKYNHGSIGFSQIGNTNFVINGNSQIQLGNAFSFGGSYIRGVFPTFIIMAENSPLMLLNTGIVDLGNGDFNFTLYYTVDNI